MASIGLDKTTGWWSIRFFDGPERGRVKKTLCKHRGEIPRGKSPRVPTYVKELAIAYERREEMARAGESGPAADTPLRPYIDEYIHDFAASRRPNSTACLRNAADKFLTWCTARKVATVQAVTVRRCDEFLTYRLSSGDERSTVVTERGYLAPIWTRARRHRLVTENPWEVAKVAGKAAEKPPKFWTIDELRKLFAACEGWARDYVILDANTGLRVGALSGLRWSHVDFPNNRIVVPKGLSKSGKSYAVPLSSMAGEVLMRRRALARRDADDALVFPGPKTGRAIHRSLVYRRIKTAVRRAGIRDFGHYCHALRHSFAVAHIEKDTHLRVIQDLLGHGSIRSTEIYARATSTKAQEVMERFDLGEPTES